MASREEWFIAQAVTGEEINIVRSETEKIYSAIEARGEKAYSSVLEKDAYEGETKMRHAFGKICSSDNFLAIIRSERKSEGMLLETGFARGKNKGLVVAVQENVTNTYIPELASRVIKYKTIEDLCEKIKKLIW